MGIEGAKPLAFPAPNSAPPTCHACPLARPGESRYAGLGVFMVSRYLFLGLAVGLAGCAPPKPAVVSGALPRATPGFITRDNPHVPKFATAGWEPFGRADAVGVALGEWRLFGQLVDDDPPDTRPHPTPDQKPERWPGLWQRIGEYWWVGQDPSADEVAWTGTHDAQGNVFDAERDGYYAWSAAFISYVMRVAGAGPDFPYGASHAIYIDAAAGNTTKLLTAHRPREYAPNLGDLICAGRGSGARVHYEDLPTAHVFPAHCDIVVAHTGNLLSVVGGNVDDAVSQKHIPVGADGKLADASGDILDTRYDWLVVLQVNYTR